ncbi:hypothetical protein F5Y18DRAFT_94663 [Xylariaceae sp. FL1019]|nr:hypothetical protein F5Y18DRAFT_94663 [Xylariaceae sp. FL1019]
MGRAEAPTPLAGNSQALIRYPNHAQFPASFQTLRILISSRNHPLYGRVAHFLFQAYIEWSLGRPKPGSWPVLTRLNAMGALLRNTSVLLIPAEYLETDDYDFLSNKY